MLLRELSKQNLVGLLQGLHQLTEDSLRAQLYTDVSILNSAIATLNDETNIVPLQADKASTLFTKVEDISDAMTDVSLPTTLKDDQISGSKESDSVLTDIYPSKPKSIVTVNDIPDNMFQELIINSIKAINVRHGCDVATSFQLLDELKGNLDMLYPGYTELRSPSTRGKLHWMVMFSKLSLKLISTGDVIKQGARYYALPKEPKPIVEEPKPEEQTKSKLEIVELRPKGMIPVKANSLSNSIHKTSQLFSTSKSR